jgi:hypothetical protein
VKRRWAEDFEQIPVALSAPHWLPVRKTKKIARRDPGHAGCGSPADGSAGAAATEPSAPTRHPGSASRYPGSSGPSFTSKAA